MKSHPVQPAGGTAHISPGLCRGPCHDSAVKHRGEQAVLRLGVPDRSCAGSCLSHFFPPKKIRLSFYAANSVRIGLLVLFVLVLLGYGIYIYDYSNPFEILHWPVGADFWTLYAWTVIMIVVVVSLFIYRPFCHIISPIGALTGSWSISR